MRFLILVAAVLLVSCATPKTAPKSYYAGVYAPGSVEISETGTYLSKAVVWDPEDRSIARKSAFARLLLEAKGTGYRSFSIDDEKSSTVLGSSHSVRGTLYKSLRTGEGIYPIDAIKRLLKDLPLEAPKPVYKHAPKKAAQKGVRKTAKRPVETNQVKSEAKAAEEPLVIMAPEDITGSIRATTGGSTPGSPLRANSVPSGLGTGLGLETSDIGAASGVPKGVLLRRK